MKKVLLVVLIIILAVAWSFRFHSINRNIVLPFVQVFTKGIQVPIEKDFFITSDENMDGYTVTVISAELLTAEDFLTRFNSSELIDLLGIFTDHIYEVRVLIENRNNPFINESGIPLGYYDLKGIDYILSLDAICFKLANPDMPGTSFSIREGTCIEIILPFDVMSSQTSPTHLKKHPPLLQISLYPHQKLIELY